MAESHKTFPQRICTFFACCYASLYTFWRETVLHTKVLHALDAWLWRRGFHRPQLRGMALGQILFAACSLVFGLVFFVWTLWPLLFAVGTCIFVYVFWGIARHLSGALLSAYSTGLLFGSLIRTTLRMFVVAIVLYVTLVVCSASAIALVCGMTANMTVALGIFAHFAFYDVYGRN